MTHVFGLTGGVASGKSTVARYFASQGVALIDADELAREVVIPGSAALQEIAATFGAQVLTATGELDRRRLGQAVFGNPTLREQLNAIVHPHVAERFRERVAALQKQGVPLACYDVPLLFERNLQNTLRPVVVVSAPADLQLARLMARNGLSSTEAAARIAAQMPLADKVAQADYVIDNSGSLENTEQQAALVLAKIREAPYRPRVFFHGTRADLKPGDLLQPGYSSNYTPRRSPWIYFSETLPAATWGAELAKGEGPGRIYVVEPLGSFMDDPNVTNKRFPGNPTKSFRSQQPLRIVSEHLNWQGHTPEEIQAMKTAIVGLDPVDD
jgi:dephospho-CoA kinase